MDDDHFRKVVCVCMFKENLVILICGCEEKEEIGHVCFVKVKFGTREGNQVAS